VAASDRGVPDLDKLIGEAEAEAARRRAAPGYPHQLEARIDAELARFAPVPRGRELEHLVTGVEEAAFVNADAPITARWRGLRYLKVALKRLLSWYLGHVTEQVSVLGLMTARALAALTGRLEELQGRVAKLEGADAGRPIELPPRPAGAGPDRKQWLDEFQTLMATLDGRILYADADVEATVAQLRVAGVDAYGLSPDGDGHRSSLNVRRGQLLAHLKSVDDGVLGGVVLVGYPDAMDGGSLRSLIDRLQRVVAMDGRVVVVGEAPWWWRERLGPVEADLADGRPLSAETWIAAFDRAGFSATGRYATDGRSYGVVAQRQAEPASK
jgi:hypothetical protein